MIEDDNTAAMLPSDKPTPKTNLEKQIHRLIKEDAEQRTRTLSYYQDLKKTNPKLYLDAKIAIQMDSDAVALGQAFFDTED